MDRCTRLTSPHTRTAVGIHVRPGRSTAPAVRRRSSPCPVVAPTSLLPRCPPHSGDRCPTRCLYSPTTPRHPLLGVDGTRGCEGCPSPYTRACPTVTAATAPVRHVITRRYTNSVSQLNVRLHDDLRARLRSAAAERGVSQSRLIRVALEQVLADDARVPASLQDAARPSWEPPSPSAFRFDRWLAHRTGLPRMLTERMIIRGRVRIEGVVCRDLVLAAGDICAGEVTVDGKLCNAVRRAHRWCPSL
jgi:hypothetical protein